MISIAPSLPPMSELDRSLCAAASAALRGVLWPSALSLLLTAIALAACILDTGRTRSLIASTLLGAVACLIAVRLVIDASLFAALADSTIPSLPALDDSLHRLGLRAPVHETRPLDERIAGTWRLVSWQLGTIGLQFAALVSAFRAHRALRSLRAHRFARRPP